MTDHGPMIDANPRQTLHDTTDAAVWAREFLDTAKRLKDPFDEGWVIGWFANAIETGRTHGAAKGQAFKDFVHRRLDTAGVPTHPEGPHSADGCRIGDRLDIALGSFSATTVSEGKPHG